MMQRFSLRTTSRSGFVDITQRVQSIVTNSGVSTGLCTVYVPHTTAGIVINEHADPDVSRDIIASFSRIVPSENGYTHREGNSAAHIKSCMTGCSQTIIIENGNLLLVRGPSHTFTFESPF